MCVFCSGGDEFRFPYHIISDQKKKTGQPDVMKIRRQLKFHLNSYIIRWVSVVKQHNLVIKMLYSISETTCFGQKLPSSGFYTD